MKPILFYSKSCGNCRNLWKILVTNNQLDQFIKISIDNNKKIPSIITSVPAVYVKGRTPIFGNAINMYLRTATASPKSTPQIGNNAKPNFQAPAKLVKNLDKKPIVKTSTNGLENILDFNPIEMSSNLSDSYSFIQSNPEPIDFCYQFIDSKNSTTTTERMPPKKGNNFDSRLQQLQDARSNMNRQ